MLTMVHSNCALVENGVFKVDRKFHVGMLSYVRGVHAPILAVHPESTPSQPIMDAIEVRCAELGYAVMTLKTDKSMRPLGSLRDAIQRSRLVYGGDLASAEMAGKLGVPYVLAREYDLQTQICVATSQVSNKLRRAVRAVRCALAYFNDIPLVYRASQLHCNGYPIFDETKWFNDKRLLYLDSRMSAEMVIPEGELLARLSNRNGRPLRLLYSGRYEPMKGADDAVRVALACLRRGMNVEMHCYGQGGLRDEMRRLAAKAPVGGRINVHDAIPFPDLVELSRTFDVFVCCHVQGDPSCTYLESFGSGLPIVGYGNRMWRRLSEASCSGFWSPLRMPEAVADSIQKLIADTEVIDRMSMNARKFALEHTFEREFSLRIAALNSALDAAIPA